VCGNQINKSTNRQSTINNQQSTIETETHSQVWWYSGRNATVLVATG
jgi:hypothetical protein